jgi:hypothetical protein
MLTSMKKMLDANKMHPMLTYGLVEVTSERVSIYFYTHKLLLYSSLFSRTRRNLHGKVVVDGWNHGTHKFQKDEYIRFH